MSDTDMAKWCNKELAAFKKNKSRWSKNTLSKYAEFSIIKGQGYEITKIYEPIFSASARKEVGEKWFEHWGYNGNLIDSNTACWYKLKPYMENKDIKDKTGIAYISYWKCEDFGVARKGKKREGKKGRCHYTFCVIVNGIPTAFDEEDCMKKAELEKIYLNPTYKEQKYEIRAIYSEYQRGEISKEEYEETLNEIVEQDLGWNKFEVAFNEYLQEKYIGNKYEAVVYADFRQELEERAWEEEKGRS